MSHLTERALGLHAINPDLVGAGDRMHLAACDHCRLALETLREFEDALRDPETWSGLSPAAPSAGSAELRAFAVRAAAEDEEALLLLADFEEPSAAARFMWDDIGSRPEYQTGGVARLLCKWAHAMCECDPLYALKLAEAATEISRALAGDSYPRSTIHDLRGEALKEQANALLVLGRLADALRAVMQAEAEYNKVPHESIGLASVKYLRGAIHYEQDELDAAELAASQAAESAQRLGSGERYMNARHLLGHVLLDRRDYEAATAVFQDILKYGHASRSPAWIARETLAIGICYLEPGRLREASRYLHEALRLFTELGFGADVTRTQWAIARLVFAEGNTTEPIYRLRRCIQDFSDQRIITDAAVVAVDLAEMLNMSLWGHTFVLLLPMINFTRRSDIFHSEEFPAPKFYGDAQISAVSSSRGILGVAMARPLRIEFAGALYHVTSRGNERRPIFRSDRDRRTFLTLLEQAAKRFRWSVTAYVLMTNHFHLVIQTPDANLSAVAERHVRRMVQSSASARR